MRKVISSIIACLLVTNLSFTSVSAATINESNNTVVNSASENSVNDNNTYMINATDESNDTNTTEESIQNYNSNEDKSITKASNSDEKEYVNEDISQIITKSITYDAHVKKIGWQDYVNESEIAGTVGKSLPMEAFKMSLKDKFKGVTVSYQAHVSKIGWQPWVNEGEIAGTTGKSLPIEAVRVRIVETVHPESFDIEQSSVSLAIKETTNLSTKFTPEDTTIKSVIWESTDSNVVSVDENGRITAKAEGQAIIKGTTKDGELTDTCNVEVHSVALNNISVNKRTDSILVGKTDKLSVIYSPSNATNQNVKWTSSNNSIATVDNNGNVKGIKEGNVVITATSEEGNYTSSCNVTIKDYHPSVTYRAFCQRQGWQKTVSNGQTAGNVGKSLRIESLNIGLKDAPPGAKINYNVYVHGRGWFNTASNNANTGTTNRALAIEGLKVYLTNCPGYTLQYRVYVQGLGWQQWVTDGMTAGAIGRSLKIEAFEIKITKSVQVKYKTYQQKIGWTSEVTSSAISGTNGQPYRIEGMTVKLVNAPANASLKYQSYIQGIGWQRYSYNGQLSGTTGQGRRVEAIRCYLENLPGYTLQYQVFIQNRGWTNWINAGGIAGTTGQRLRIEAVRFRVLQTAEGTTFAYVTISIIASYWKLFRFHS